MQRYLDRKIEWCKSTGKNVRKNPQINRQINTEINIQREGQKDRHSDRWKDRETGKKKVFVCELTQNYLIANYYFLRS